MSLVSSSTVTVAADGWKGIGDRRYTNYIYFLAGAASLPLARLLLFAEDRQLTVEQLIYMTRKSAICALFAFLSICLFVLVRKRSLSALVEYVARDLLSVKNVMLSIAGLAGVALFSNAFTVFKEAIPSVHPYSLDPFFMWLDGVVHFGWQPWELLSGILGYGSATIALDFVYYLWFVVVFVSIAVAVIVPGDNLLRDRFLVAYVLSWLLIGVGMAYAMSSVGPIFYDRLEGGPSPFTAMIAQLDRINADTPLTAVLVRDKLWANYMAPSGSVISGISAMPSMHNALCILLVLAARRINPILFVASIVFALVIFVGSVHLGWHYAIDAYVSAVAVWLIWMLAGRIVGDQPVDRVSSTHSAAT